MPLLGARSQRRAGVGKRAKHADGRSAICAPVSFEFNPDFSVVFSSSSPGTAVTPCAILVRMEHDASYKLLFSHARMMEDLLQGFVHEAWVHDVDFATLERVSDSHISPKFPPLTKRYPFDMTMVRGKEQCWFLATRCPGGGAPDMGGEGAPSVERTRDYSGRM